MKIDQYCEGPPLDSFLAMAYWDILTPSIDLARPILNNSWWLGSEYAIQMKKPSLQRASIHL